MPTIQVDTQIFDVVFHPTSSIAYIALLDGNIKAFAYNEQGNHKALFSLQPVKKSCRGLSIDQDGSHLYAVGKGRALSSIDTETEALDIRKKAHDSTINRVKYLMPWMLATGDDDGVVKLWDPRRRDSIRTYTQHFDYITDFLWLDDKKQVVATSGDGTLSVMDVRAKKSSLPVAQSEDQEDELLSIVSIKGASKIVVGTQIGMLSVFNRSSGWGDCVDRIPGHPLSVDALCSLPSDLPGVDTQSTILTGSSDGLVRAVKILPTKLHGVVVDHGDWPIERIATGAGLSQLTIDNSEETEKATKIGSASTPNHGEDLPDPHTRWWVGSVGHDEVFRLTDLGEFFHDEKDEGEDLDEPCRDEDDISLHNSDKDPEEIEGETHFASIEQYGVDQAKKRKRQPTEEPSTSKKKGKRNAVVVEASFFDGI